MSFSLITIGVIQNAIFDNDVENKTYTCAVCDRNFKANTSNSKNIIKTGMCDLCEKNYDWAMDALGKK